MESLKKSVHNLSGKEYDKLVKDLVSKHNCKESKNKRIDSLKKLESDRSFYPKTKAHFDS